jgi:predicted RNA binding protein YcfA (HicA-like mRNA interferase family)
VAGLSGYSNHHEQPANIIKQREADGWLLARVKGSHHQFKHPTKPGLVTVKHPDGDIPAGTLNSIQKQAGWKK